MKLFKGFSKNKEPKVSTDAERKEFIASVYAAPELEGLEMLRSVKAYKLLTSLQITLMDSNIFHKHIHGEYHL